MKKYLFALILCTLFSVHTHAQTPPVQPNIVLILVDDLSTMETTASTMPKLYQHIVNQGVSLTKFYIPQSLCCPSRATLLTGQQPHKSGMITNAMEANYGRVYFGGTAWFRFLGLDQDTLATRMKAAGYYTAFSGTKYMNLPNTKLVSYTATSIQTITDSAYVPPGWEAWYLASGNGGNDPHNGYNWLFKSKIGNGPLVSDRVVGGVNPNANNYWTDLVFARANADIDRAGTQPFFVNIWTTTPHTPFRAASRHLEGCAANVVDLPVTASLNENNVADKAPPMRKEKYDAIRMEEMKVEYNIRLCSLKAIDEGIENLVTHLAEVPGRLENTFIIFMSDNGFLQGEHRQYGKSVAYEESSRVPFFVRGPQVPGAGVHPNFRKARGLTVLQDIPVTLLNIAGAAPGPSMSGRSILQAFTAPTVFNNTGSKRKVVLLQGNTSGIPVQAVTPTNGLVATECSILPEYNASSSSEYIADYLRSRKNFWGLRTDNLTYIRYCNSDGQGYAAAYPPEAGVMFAHRELYNNVADPKQLSSLLEQPEHMDGIHRKPWSVATGQLAQAVNPYFIKELDDRIDALKSCTSLAACNALEDAPFLQPMY